METRTKDALRQIVACLSTAVLAAERNKGTVTFDASWIKEARAALNAYAQDPANR